MVFIKNIKINKPIIICFTVGIVVFIIYVIDISTKKSLSVTKMYEGLDSKNNTKNDNTNDNTQTQQNATQQAQQAQFAALTTQIGAISTQVNSVNTQMGQLQQGQNQLQQTYTMLSNRMEVIGEETAYNTSQIRKLQEMEQELQKELAK